MDLNFFLDVAGRLGALFAGAQLDPMLGLAVLLLLAALFMLWRAGRRAERHEKNLKISGDRLAGDLLNSESRLKAEIRHLAELQGAVAVSGESGREAGEDGRPDGTLRESIEQQSLYLHDQFALLVAKLEEMKNLAGSGGAPGAELDPAALKRLSEEISAKISELSGNLEAALGARMEKALDDRLAGAQSAMDAVRKQMEEIAAASEEMKNAGQSLSAISRMVAPRGADSGRRLSDLLAQILSPEHFTLDASLPNGSEAAALVNFPDPADSIAIDSGLPMQSFNESQSEGIPAEARDEKRRAFAAALSARINHVADNLIAPPHTSDMALLFIPSEAAFAEIHARHHSAVDLALSRRVWLVSPTTLLAIAGSANIAIRNHHARERLRDMQAALVRTLSEAQDLKDRLVEIGQHVNAAMRGVQRAESDSGRLIGDIQSLAPQPPGKAPGTMPKPAMPKIEAKPATPKPETAAPKPATPKPEAADPKPAMPKPEAADPKPATPKPETAAPKPATPKPEAADPKPAMPKPEAADPKPATPKPETADPKPATSEPAPPAVKPAAAPPTAIARPAPSAPRPAAATERPPAARPIPPRIPPPTAGKPSVAAPGRPPPIMPTSQGGSSAAPTAAPNPPAASGSSAAPNPPATSAPATPATPHLKIKSPPSSPPPPPPTSPTPPTSPSSSSADDPS